MTNSDPLSPVHSDRLSEQELQDIRERWYGKRSDDGKAITALLDELSRLRSERVTLARLVFPVYDPSGLDAYNAIQLARQVLTEEETGR